MSFVSFPHPPFLNGRQGERDDWMTQHYNAILWCHRIIYAIMHKYLVRGPWVTWECFSKWTLSAPKQWLIWTILHGLSFHSLSYKWHWFVFYTNQHWLNIFAKVCDDTGQHYNAVNSDISLTLLPVEKRQHFRLDN